MTADRAVPDDDGGMDRFIGEVLANRYQIEARLGEGAMGTVYRARHVKLGRGFAVKVLHSTLLEDAKVAQRFEREAELAGRLRHPNVVGVIDIGDTAGGLRYMVMELANGPDLAALLGEAPMQGPRVVNLTRQMLEGLYHAHESGLIHRDFKPENVIVEADASGTEVPRIVDFGIAILREAGSGPDGEGRLTTNGLVLGTPQYMAPEQAVADPIDHRIDLFALGVVVYEMLCGRLPFDGSGVDVARANLLLDPPPIAQRVPLLEVDPLLEAFARRLMAKKREARPATARAARELLDLIERDRAAAASALGVSLATVRGPTVTAASAPEPRRHEVPDEAPRPRGRLIAGGGVLVAVAIVLVVVATRPRDQPGAPVTASPTTADNAPPPPAPTAVVELAADAGVEVVAIPDAGLTRAKGPRGKKVAPKIKEPRTTAKTSEPAPAPAPANVTLDANRIAVQYGTIGKRLRDQGPNADPNWWVLYRRIKINEAMKDPALLSEAAQLLARVHAEMDARATR